ncbi:MAG: chemotaxis protein CheX [Lachnospiraceae bacterium]
MLKQTVERQSAADKFFADAVSKIGHHRSIKHFIMAYNCIKFYADSDISLSDIRIVDEYDADYFACQMSHGDTDVLFGLSGTQEAMLHLAECIAEESFTEINEDSYDVMCEFTNMVNGNFAGFLEEDDMEMEAVPPMCCQNCHVRASGNFCVLSLQIDGKSLEFVSIIDVIPYMS